MVSIFATVPFELFRVKLKAGLIDGGLRLEDAAPDSNAPGIHREALTKPVPKIKYAEWSDAFLASLIAQI